MWGARWWVGPGLRWFPLPRWLVLGMLVGIVLPRGLLMAQSYAAVAGCSGASVGDAEVIQVAPQCVRAGVAGTMLMHLHFPEGYHLNPCAPLHYSVSGAGIAIAAADRTGRPMAPSLPLAIPFQAAAGRQQATADIDMTYCREDAIGVCAMQSVRWQVPLHTAPEASGSAVVILYTAEAPAVHRQ